MPLRNQIGLRVPASADPPDPRIESFLERLRMAGYTPESIRIRRAIASAFVAWARRKGLSADECDESHVVAFLRRSEAPPEYRILSGRATVRLFLRHIRGQDGVHHTPLRFDSAPDGGLERRYLDHLHQERGFAKNSILVYMFYIREFLSALSPRKGSPDLSRLNAQWIQKFMLGRLRGRSSEWTRLLTVTLRSFLRFLFVRGETPIDLSFSVPMVRKWRQASVPQYLAPGEVARVLSATRRLTVRGRRDYAILLLLARLGVRANEVVLLELGDIRWRSGEMVVRGKGGVLNRLPLLSEVGKALAAYLRRGRPVSPSRRVFLRLLQPYVGLTGPAAVAHIARDALARAGIRRTSRGAAHIFRHSLATRMIRSGASLPEISEVLGHRSPGTTAIYAKVDFDALRTVARPWPRVGGVR